MSRTLHGDLSLDELAEEFARRLRDGERPSVEEYAARYPLWAADIREMFPAVQVMEQLKPRREDRSPASPPAAQHRFPERLGEYRLLREIGRGGMGVVYEARQETLGREVALKVLPAHLLANEKLRLRFRRESQAAARLHHTNIVPVFGVGEQDGLCWYVMQLIHGRSIDLALGERSTPADAGTQPTGQTPAGPRPTPTVIQGTPRFSAQAIARMGVQVADALAYAHDHGILHRDVKPSNLLLDDQGTVWVTDFGVAKLLEEAQLTQSGEYVGTLRYMSPERFLGHCDARGDVYSLGITLYEMLAGRPAFPDTTPEHLIRLITEGEPPRFEALGLAVPADLETIVLKATARDPAHRYQTAGELADDLRRFLDDRPVHARRIGALGQLWRWCLRNRLVAGLAAAVVGLLLLTSVVFVIAFLHTSAANQKAQTALDAEHAQRERAERMSASALVALNRVYEHFAPSRIVATATLPADDSGEDRVEIPPQPVLSPETASLLEELLGFYEQVAREGSDSPKLQAQAAEANQRIGDIRQRLGQLEPAIAAYRKAGELYGRLPTDARDEAVGIKMARTYNELGCALQALQRGDEAREANGQALAALSEAKEFVTRPEFRYELARTYYLQAQWESPPRMPEPDRDRPGRGRDGPNRGPGRGPGQVQPGRDGPHPTECGPSQMAIDLLEELVKDHPLVPEYRHLLACCYRDAPGPRPRDRGPGANASRAIELLRRLVADFPKVPDYRYELCETLARAAFSGRPVPADSSSAAKQMLEEAVGSSGALASDYPNVPLYTASHTQARNRLGELLLQLQQPDEAEKVLRRAVGLQAGLVKQHPEVVAYDFSLAMIQATLSRALSDHGNVTEAQPLLETATGRAVALLEKNPRFGFVRGFLGRGWRDLSQALARQGNSEGATRAQRQAEDFSPPRKPDFGPRDRPGERR
jgi:tetratricopeptide (TPR) repeat protein